MDIYRTLEIKVNDYMGTGALMVLFGCALLFWAVKKEKSDRMRLYLGYVLILLIGSMNPLSLYVIDKTGNLGVFERFFWLLMGAFFVSVVLALLVHKKGKMLIPCLLVLLLGGNLVFTEIEYMTAENPEKISTEAIEVSEIIMRDFEGLPEGATVVPNRPGIESPKAVIPEPINEEIRMYNANIKMWYVRKGFGSYKKRGYRKLSSAMTLESGAVTTKRLFRNMNKYDFEYFVLGKNQELTGNVKKYDVELIGETENYSVYRYREREQFVLKQFPDVEGHQSMSYTIRNHKNKLVVVDGGRAWQTQALVKEIKKWGGKVDTWIITHPHDDHCGVLASVLEAEWDKTEIEIGRILIGEMDYEAVMEEASGQESAFAYLNMGLDRFENVTWLKAGDELDVIGLKMKVLHTCNETVLKNSDNIMNDGSMVFKLSGQKRSVLFLADTADNSDEIAKEVSGDYSRGSEIGRLIADEILANYPEDVKSDYVQMSNHGNGSYPDYFYEAIAPRIAFFDAPDWLMENKDMGTGEAKYYSTPHYVELMKDLGAKIYSYSSKKHYVKFR